MVRKRKKQTLLQSAKNSVNKLRRIAATLQGYHYATVSRFPQAIRTYGNTRQNTLSYTGG